MTKIIKDAESAIEWLAQNAPWALSLVKDGIVTESNACQRCGGSGRRNGFEHVLNGVCFLCAGANTSNYVNRTPVVEFARRLRNAQTARDRSEKLRAAKQAAYESSPAAIAKREREEAQSAAAAVVKAENAWLIEGLAHEDSDFAASIRADLAVRPLSAFSERALGFIARMYAKGHGRGGSKAYKAAEDAFWDRVQPAETL